MLNAGQDKSRESRRRSENPRDRQSQSSIDASRRTSDKQNAEEDHLERNVAANFLSESSSFEGFVYLMRQSNHPMASQLREELFPALTLALEATLSRAVHHQMDVEKAAGITQKSIASAKGKMYRNRAYFPDKEIQVDENDSSFDVIKILAEELKGARQRQQKPQSK